MIKDSEEERETPKLELPPPAAAPSGFDARFKKLGDPLARAEGRFRVQFYRLPNSETAHLVQYLQDKLIHFCLPRHEVARAYAAAQPNDLSATVRLYAKARDLLITARSQQSKAGEPSELLLFTFLETVTNAPRLACKMALKTSANMPVHGSDAIHAKMDGAHLKIIWGESKMYQDGSAAISRLGTSLQEFLAPSEETGTAPRDRDIQIVEQHIEIENDEMRRLVLNYFDPYADVADDLREGFGCIVLFDASLYSEGTGPEEWLQEAADKLVSQVESSLASVPSKYDVDVFLLPVPSVKSLREAFFKKIGVAE